jgi:prevent-host-death family protein
MYSTNIHEAKTHLSKWLELAAHGEEIIICKNGTPLARLVPLASNDAKLMPRKPGLLEGKIFIKCDFDTMPEDFMVHFK